MTKLQTIISRDITANRPAFGIPGQLFYDTTLNKWQRDNGTGWDDCAGVAGAPTDYPYLGFGLDGDLSAEVDITAAELANEVMNFPSLEGADNVQPEWWEVSTATLTEVDLAGEGGITESWQRALKVVTAGTPRYAYQRYTYADQPRLKVGKTVAAIFAVWSVGAAPARIVLQSSVGILGGSSWTTAAGWTILTVAGVVLDGTYVDICLEVNTGTAYFVPLGLHVGARGVPLPPRQLVYQHKDGSALLLDMAGFGDPNAWTDIDCTAASGNLAARVNCFSKLYDDVEGYTLFIRRNGSAEATGDANSYGGTIYPDNPECAQIFQIVVDDGQIFEYNLDRFAGAGTLAIGLIYLLGWWEWA